MTSAIALPRPIPYPERRLPRNGFWERVEGSVGAALHAHGTGRRAMGLAAVTTMANDHAEMARLTSDAALAQRVARIRQTLTSQQSWADPVLAEALALVREAANRALGQYAFDGQVTAAAAALRGMMAEMATGEGKTLAAMLAAAVAALGGIPVHLVTVNPYLAERDATAGAPLYHRLGLTVGLVTERVPSSERRAAYRCDITVCTSKDLAFDYMRDRVAAGRRLGTLRQKAARLAGATRPGAAPLLRGLHFAIIDEADSVLIDEARTPLILATAGGDGNEAAIADTALALAAALRPGADFALLKAESRVDVTLQGRDTVAARAPNAAPWDEAAECQRLVDLALTALHTLHRGEHYVIQDGCANLVDEYTGRIMADRTWSDGLQAMVERKEGLALSERHTTHARMTYQRFFRRYRRLAGMSGTLAEVAAELWQVYRMPVATIPRNRADRRVVAPAQAAMTAAEKWRSIAAAVAEIHVRGAPVLIGTRTVAGSDLASAALTAAGLHHVKLNAVHNAGEAAVIAAAGQTGAITVATNLAGRGTDIRLSPAAVAAGGLHVILSERHEARRIDRQLAGRCGRQGDPGVVLTFCALDDGLVVRHAPAHWLWAARHWRIVARGSALARAAQRRAERLHARMRRDLLHSDEWLGDAVAFAGERE